MTLLPPIAEYESSFARVLRERLDRYFIERNLSPKANSMMIAKIVLGIGMWLGGFVTLYAVPLQAWQVPLFYVFLALPQTFLILNVAHDSIHNAISRERLVNKLLAYIYDGCGVSSYLVRILHNHGHHSTINLLGEDDPLGGRRVFRFTKHAPHKRFHRFQHLYAVVFYPMFSLDYVFLRDFEDFLIPTLGYLKRMRHRKREYVILFAGKLAYLTYVAALPIFYLGYSAASVILGFFLMHFVMGFLVAAVFAPTHILECNDFPQSRAEYPDYARHIFATTCDFATRSPLVTWLTGGLNHHIVHHICPHVCHVHYPALTWIAKETASEFRIPYKEMPTMRGALLAHYALLRQLAQPA
jgi:linoleoyl-CoA desaturase